MLIKFEGIKWYSQVIALEMKIEIQNSQSFVHLVQARTIF